jgi:hypothetical protein
MAHGVCRLTAYEGDGIVAGMHTWGERKLAGVFSLRGKQGDVELGLPDGDYINLIDVSAVTVAEGKLHCSGKPVIIEA